MSAVAGRILLMAKGDYSSATTYNTLDWVRYNNAAWVCKEDNVQNDPPSISSTKWALMAADSAMSDLGDLNDVVISSEAAGQFLGCYIDTSTTPATITWRNLSAETTYSSSGTAPISGTGVADALLSYYTKSEIDLDNILKYGGTKTAAELTTNTLLVAANAGKYYRASEDFTTTSDYVQGSGLSMTAGSHIAVIEVSTGTYKFDYMGGYVDTSSLAKLTQVPIEHKRSGVTVSAGQTVRIPSSGTKATIKANRYTIPICDNGTGKAVKYTSMNVYDGYAEITLAEDISNATIGLIVFRYTDPD